MKPIYVDEEDVRVRGVVIGVLRQVLSRASREAQSRRRPIHPE